MSNFKRKSSLFIFTIIIAVTFTIFVSAGTGNSAVGNVGRGYINVQLNSVTAWTEAFSSGTSSTDYVYVSFQAWDEVYHFLCAENSKKNIGANYVEAYCSKTSYQNIGEADSLHTIQRGNAAYQTWNENIHP